MDLYGSLALTGVGHATVDGISNLAGVFAGRIFNPAGLRSGGRIEIPAYRVWGPQILDPAIASGIWHNDNRLLHSMEDHLMKEFAWLAAAVLAAATAGPVNAGGKGTPVELETVDTGNEPQRGIEAYERFKNEGAVLVDFLSTPVSRAVVPRALCQNATEIERTLRFGTRKELTAPESAVGVCTALFTARCRHQADTSHHMQRDRQRPQPSANAAASPNIWIAPPRASRSRRVNAWNWRVRWRPGHACSCSTKCWRGSTRPRSATSFP